MPRTQSRYHIGFGFVVPTRTKPDTNIVLGSEGLTRVPTFRGREPETTTIAGWRAVLFTTVASCRAVLFRPYRFLVVWEVRNRGVRGSVSKIPEKLPGCP